MQTLLKIASIVSITVATLKIGMMGLLSEGWIIFIMICAVLILAGGKKVFKLAAAVAAIMLLSKFYGKGNPQMEGMVLQSVLTLALVLFGIYIMIRGFFNPKQ